METMQWYSVPTPIGWTELLSIRYKLGERGANMHRYTTTLPLLFSLCKMNSESTNDKMTNQTFQ